MSSLGTATLGSDFDPKGLKAGLDSALGTTNGFMSSFKRIWETAIGFILSNVIMRLVAGIRNVGDEVFNAAARFQALQIQIEGLQAREIFRLADGAIEFKDALVQAVGPAKELVQWVKEVAVTTPFTVESLQNTLSTAMAMGFATDQAKRLTVAAGNFTAGMGLSNEVLQRIIYNFGQMKASGKIMGTELRDLARGALVPVNDVFAEMQKQLGKTDMDLEAFKDSMKDSEDGVDLFISTFVSMVERDFAGAADRMSRTWQGLTSNIQDFVQANLGAGLLQPTLDRLSESLSGVLDELLRPDLQEALGYLGETLAKFVNIDLQPGDFVDSLVEGIQRLGLALSIFQQTGDTRGLLERLGLSSGTIDLLFKAGDALQWVRDNWDELKIALLAIAAPTIFAGIISSIVGLVAALATPIGVITLLIGAIAVFYFAWTQNWGGMRDTLQSWWASVKTIWGNFTSALQSLGAFLAPFFSTISESFGELWNALRTTVLVVQQAFEPVWPLFQQLWTALQPIVNFIGTVLVGLLIGAGEIIAGVILGVVGLVIGLITGLAQGVTAFLGHIQAIADGMAQMWTGIITGLTGSFNIIVGIFTGQTDLIQQGWEQWKEGVVTTATALWENLKTGFSAAFDFIEGLVSGFVDGVTNFFGTLFDKLVGHSIVPDIMEGIKAVFSGGFPDLLGVIQGGISTFQGIFTQFLQVLTSPAQFFTEALTTMFMTTQTFITNFMMVVQTMWVAMFTMMGVAAMTFSAGPLKSVLLALSIFINHMKNVQAEGHRLVTFLTVKLAGGFSSLAGAVGDVIGQVKALQRAFDQLHVPAIFTPGSPTPFEIGLRGIIRAMDDMSRVALPSLQSSFGNLKNVEQVAALGQTRNYNNSFTFRDTTLDPEQLAAIQRRQELLNG